MFSLGVGLVAAKVSICSNDRRKPRFSLACRSRTCRVNRWIGIPGCWVGLWTSSWLATSGVEAETETPVIPDTPEVIEVAFVIAVEPADPGPPFAVVVHANDDGDSAKK